MISPVKPLSLLVLGASMAHGWPVLNYLFRQGYGSNAGGDTALTINVGNLDKSNGDIAWQVNTKGALGGSPEYSMFYDVPLAGEEFNVLMVHENMNPGSHLDVSKTGPSGQPCEVFVTSIEGSTAGGLIGVPFAIPDGANCLHFWSETGHQ